ncbi:transcriptional regulator, LysR family [Octadecabacter temperatus]|jgi:DNA-binding transcriptional LysR family regulator|uniref:HTH-type transcriptional regulator BenM n=1 Tax=Octadecabacter temperatus TaxID=1458307 RepID=A0A0K0Y8B1_9RHOB|nr:LysR family transcriptional regulator [Octadecabacter temperatus]AKS47203.1 HTH-type transcriptional regulator BenM [Octadecabacter temperatus]SIO45348.1 transcriptional regulator, LysR family [Octadecabacter temperatus]
MKLQQLRYFAAVYEQGSFSAAADKVNATQSGLSMHVSQIEKRYGVTLFLRSSVGVTPTEAGRSFYLEAVKVLAAAIHAEDRLQTLSKSVVGHIHVGLMPTFTRSVLTPVLLRFAKEYPEVRLSISEAYSGELAAEVSEGRLDFAVVPASFELQESLVSKRMGDDRECLVCGTGLKVPMNSNGALLKQMSPLRLVLPGKANARRRLIENYLMVNQIEVSDIMELDTMHGTLGLVANSEWVTILPGIMCQPDLDGTRRKVAPLADPPLMVDYMRIESSKRPLSIAAQPFADILQEELNSALEIAPFSRN